MTPTLNGPSNFVTSWKVKARTTWGHVQLPQIPPRSFSNPYLLRKTRPRTSMPGLITTTRISTMWLISFIRELAHVLLIKYRRILRWICEKTELRIFIKGKKNRLWKVRRATLHKLYTRKTSVRSHRENYFLRMNLELSCLQWQSKENKIFTKCHMSKKRRNRQSKQNKRTWSRSQLLRECRHFKNMWTKSKKRTTQT